MSREKFSAVCVELEKGGMFIFAGNTVIQGFRWLGK